MFTELTVKFKVVEDTAFKNGTWNKDRSDFIFEVRRFRSGCTAYGDRSGHTVEIVNHPETFAHHFDTRYSRISWKKKDWISYWKKWIQEEYVLKVEPYDFSFDTIKD